MNLIKSAAMWFGVLWVCTWWGYTFPLEFWALPAYMFLGAYIIRIVLLLFARML